MVTMGEFLEGLNITVLGVTIVFLVLTILAIILYFVGWLERRLIERETRTVAKPAVVEAPKKTEGEEVREEKIPPRDLAIITAAILAYLAKKAEALRPLPFKRKVSDVWRLYGLQTSMEEVEDFNYEIGKW